MCWPDAVLWPYHDLWTKHDLSMALTFGQSHWLKSLAVVCCGKAFWSTKFILSLEAVNILDIFFFDWQVSTEAQRQLRGEKKM